MLTLKTTEQRDRYATITVIGIGYWPLMGGLLQFVQRGGYWAGCGSA